MNFAATDAIPPARDCWYLTGPTASGKTPVGIELAQMIDAEIISLDSMSVYRDMNIGTAKPTAAQRSLVPHHLLDIVDPTQEYSLSQYVRDAQRVIGEIRQRGRNVLFVGGTPLYLKALLRGVYPGPPADWEFRQQIEVELKTVGIQALHARLEHIDPLAAAKLHPHDKRRIIRALEVFRQTGRPLSHEQTQFDDLPEEACRVVVLGWPRETLHQRIEMRVERMFEQGLVDEVRSLLSQYGELGRTASQAVGYREIITYLREGPDLAATIEQVTARTRQFARRQETWFRSLAECQRFDLSPDMEAVHVAQKIVTLFSDRLPRRRPE